MIRKKNKISRDTLKYIMAIFLFSVAIYAYIKIDSYLQESIGIFKSGDIEITGNQLLSRQQILDICGFDSRGDQQLNITPALVVQKLSRSPYIKAVSAVRSLPSKLRITVLERVPIAFIYGKGLNLIDSEGFLFPLPQNNLSLNLPYITGIKQALGRPGQRTISERTLKAVEILSYMRMIPSSLNEIVSEIDLSNQSYLSFYLIRGGAEVRFDEKNYAENLFILKYYFEKYLKWDELPIIKYVDVRFKDQLIYKEKKS